MISKKQMGFSLIEVMIAFLLFGVGMLGMVKLQTFMEHKSEHAARSLEALYLAESKLEHFRKRSVSGANGTILFGSISSGSEAKSGGYTLTWSVSQATGTVSSAVKVITIDSAWQDRLNTTQKVTLQTMLSKYNEFD
ncbi:putative Type IV fimbrial biogenesis protein PilV [Vibrio nigripulchritudo SO65]|uniref:type IV pilus modification PilV family protein n=1 Tax=Vibrio nigripulchritudo TaxID=28173 RepID=UPI0003B1B323|nr:prepilin-type N-terminal cleavage/methylation domain-containing protein [Vibrio nigripulchritudo]CCN35378.1 putative Type IV fimbrial biogenesis protein PilV [Vibrio nigripulchritudo AM115]CCN39418.1 putative Type IV fimbrial biogenesis protein PilV [Vibrio nigripulchritudo FTn2]CCN63485.1 putative Type IV fimbrial biogenesis protein PilV [Vibrio nigripulchritudo POn4]CCN72982.1 putative Type IV fimbrial biogenesis protein PilV [Vibrio nigripulchritudo SFn118]CCN78098.1 putative Type IV fim